MSKPGPSLVVMIRHGESLGNEIRDGSPYFPPAFRERLGDLSDQHIPLTVRGVSQARNEGMRLRDRFANFDAVYCSDMSRSRETADELVLTFRSTPPIVVSHLLNERDPGHPFGMTREESAQHFPWLSAYWKRTGWFYARPPGGESVADVATNRVSLFLNLLFREHPGRRILVVTHGRWIQAARVVIERLSTHEEVPHGRNCGWLVYRCHPKRPELQLYEGYHYA